MEIIIKNGNELNLTHIPDNELEAVKTNNEEVITTFSLSDSDKEKINKGCKLNSDMTITETQDYLDNIAVEIKQKKSADINAIATLSDQLNLTAGTLDIIVDLLAVTNPELLTNPWIIESKSKLNEIKTILNK